MWPPNAAKGRANTAREATNKKVNPFQQNSVYPNCLDIAILSAKRSVRLICQVDSSAVGRVACRVYGHL